MFASFVSESHDRLHPRPLVGQSGQADCRKNISSLIICNQFKVLIQSTGIKTDLTDPQIANSINMINIILEFLAGFIFF